MFFFVILDYKRARHFIIVVGLGEQGEAVGLVLRCLLPCGRAVVCAVPSFGCNNGVPVDRYA